MRATGPPEQRTPGTHRGRRVGDEPGIRPGYPVTPKVRFVLYGDGIAALRYPLITRGREPIGKGT